MLKQVTVMAQAAVKVKNQVQKVKDKARAIVDIIEAEKAVAEEKLEAAHPALKRLKLCLIPSRQLILLQVSSDGVSFL